MNVNDFIGLPYREGGRGPAVYDCYGLVAAVWREFRGAELPDWYQEEPGPHGASRAISAALAGEVSAGRSVRVENPRDLDIAVVSGGARAHHIGVVIDGGVLHAARTLGSMWHSLPRFATLYPKTEFYRWHP